MSQLMGSRAFGERWREIFTRSCLRGMGCHTLLSSSHPSETPSEATSISTSHWPGLPGSTTRSITNCSR
jgi:hypothetical protein